MINSVETEEHTSAAGQTQNLLTSNPSETITDRYSKYRNTSTDIQTHQIDDKTFELDKRYQNLKLTGCGADGITIKAKDTTLNINCTIIKLHNPFENELIAKGILRKLKIQRLLSNDHSIEIQTLIRPKSRQDFQDLYVCSKFMNTDLDRVLQSQQILSQEYAQYWIYCILRGLLYIHSAGIVHGRLSPMNIFLNSDCDLRIGGFDEAKVLDFHSNKFKADLLWGSVYYFPPFDLLESEGVSQAMDIWAAGCIMAEILLRRRLMPNNVMRQQHLEEVIRLFGPPSEDYIEELQDTTLQTRLRNMSEIKPIELESLFPQNLNPLAIDLLKRMMAINPKERLTASEALKHPFLVELHDIHDEPIRDLVPKAEFEFERYELSVEQVKDLIYEEILLYRFEDFKEEYLRKIETGESPFQHVIDSNSHFTKNLDDTDDAK